MGLNWVEPLTALSQRSLLSSLCHTFSTPLIIIVIILCCTSVSALCV